MLMKTKAAASLTACIAISAILCSCASEKTALTLPEVTGEFKTEVISCGKADALVLQTAEHTVLIDCGEDNDGDKVVDYLQENGIDSVDYLFITHFDKDHVGGAAEVIENIGVGQVVTPDYESSSDEYESYISAAEAVGLDMTRLTSNMSFILDDTLFEVYPPKKSTYEEEDNDYSLAIKVTHGSDTFLFAGDAEEERLKEIEEQLDVSADFLKVPHHGRYDDETEAFVNAVAPQYAVITCSKKEGAEQAVLDILEAAGVQTFLTTGGNITAVSTGSGITVTQTPKS